MFPWWWAGCILPCMSNCDFTKRKILLFVRFISRAWSKTTVTPLLTHWSYCSLALSHRYIPQWYILRFEWIRMCALIYNVRTQMPWHLYSECVLLSIFESYRGEAQKYTTTTFMCQRYNIVLVDLPTLLIPEWITFLIAETLWLIAITCGPYESSAFGEMPCHPVRRCPDAR